MDLLAGYLRNISETKPVFPDVEPSTLTQLFAEPLPRDASTPESVLSDLQEKLLPYCTHVGHPGYMGLITPHPAQLGSLPTSSAAPRSIKTSEPTPPGPAAVAIERRTVRWLADLVGYDEHAGGNLTSGGMMANFVAIKLARDFVSGDRIQHHGVQDRWAVYTLLRNGTSR